MNINRCYRTLGISEKEDLSSIKKAFFKFAAKYHPDKTKNNLMLQEQFVEAKLAYDQIVEFKKLTK